MGLQRNDEAKEPERRQPPELAARRLLASDRGHDGQCGADDADDDEDVMERKHGGFSLLVERQTAGGDGSGIGGPPAARLWLFAWTASARPRTALSSSSVGSRF